MTSSIMRMEQALRLWEDHCNLYQKMIQVAKANPGGMTVTTESGITAEELPGLDRGALANAKSFRQYLINSFSNEESEFDYERYVGDQRIGELLGAKSKLPMHLWAWTMESRRVYQLSQELQLLLGVTSLKDVVWGDLRYPFNAFGIALEDPIIDEKSGAGYDFLLVSKITKKSSVKTWTDIEFMLFPEQLKSYKSASIAAIKRADAIWQRRRWRQAAQWINTFQKKFSQGHGVVNLKISLSKNANAPIVDQQWSTRSVTPTWDSHVHKGDLLSLTEKTVRIVAGLVLYLKHLPPKNCYVKGGEGTINKIPQKYSKRQDNAYIGDTAQVCTVSSKYRLTPKEMRILKECETGVGGYEVRTHFRTGHWRRPPRTRK